MASLTELENAGRTGFNPEWDDYDGRAYQWRVKAGKRSWPVALCFRYADECEHLPGNVSTPDWRRAISKGIRETDEEIAVEIVYRDYRKGKPISRLSVLKGTRYPVAIRTVRGGGAKPTVLWAKGERYENKEKLPAPTASEMLNAEIGMSVKWYVFVWDGTGWQHLASVADTESRDALVSFLKKQGKETYTMERQRGTRH